MDIQKDDEDRAYRISFNTGKIINDKQYPATIEIIQTGVDNIHRPTKNNQIFRQYLTGQEWPIFQVFPHLSNVFHYRNFAVKYDKSQKEELRVW